MADLESILNDLVIANRILANENVVDAYGHVSVRHPRDPQRFFLARSLSPERVERGGIMGEQVPVWDIRDKFGDTNLLVTNMPQGLDLARTLGGNNVALMRGHGFVAAARSLIEVVRMSVYVPRNARVLLAALRVGEVKPLSPGEIAARNAGYKPYSPETWRAWEYWATRAGCAHLLSKKD